MDGQWTPLSFYEASHFCKECKSTPCLQAKWKYLVRLFAWNVWGAREFPMYLTTALMIRFRQQTLRHILGRLEFGPKYCRVLKTFRYECIDRLVVDTVPDVEATWEENKRALKYKK